MNCWATAWARGSDTFVFFVPDHCLPKLHLVSLRIHDLRELPVLVRLRPANDFDSASAELRNQLAQIVYPIIDHERRVARTEPSALFFRDVPYSETLVLCLVIQPFQNGATEALQRHTKVLLIPSRKFGAIVPAFEEDAADSGNFCHCCFLPSQVLSIVTRPTRK